VRTVRKIKNRHLKTSQPVKAISKQSKGSINPIFRPVLFNKPLWIAAQSRKKTKRRKTRGRISKHKTEMREMRVMRYTLLS
jgi:hypothetical protein